MNKLATFIIVVGVALTLAPTLPMWHLARALDYTYTTPLMKFTVTENGEVPQLEAPLGYEHIYVGSILEGYLVSYAGGEGYVTEYSMNVDRYGIVTVGSVEVENSASRIIVGTVTQDSPGNLQIDQFFVASKAFKYVGIKMTVTNLGGSPISSLVVKRFCDMDVDTAGAMGWAGYDNYFNYLPALGMPYAWTTSSQPPPHPGRASHYLAMATYPNPAIWNLDGWDYYYDRDTPQGPSGVTFGDLAPLVHWNVGTLGPHQSVTFYVVYAVGNNLGDMFLNVVRGRQAAFAIPWTFVSLPPV